MDRRIGNGYDFEGRLKNGDINKNEIRLFSTIPNNKKDALVNVKFDNLSEVEN